MPVLVSAPRAGRDGARSGVAEIQRARMLAAITEFVHERGVPAVSVAHVVARSGVSRRTFYEQFADRDDCLLAAFELAVERAAAVVAPAYEQARVADGAAGASALADSTDDPWPARVRAGLAALLGFLDAEPSMGGLLVVDSLAAHRLVLERRARAVEALIDAVHAGGAPSRGGPDATRPPGADPGADSASGRHPRPTPGGDPARRPPRIVAEGTVGAVLAIVHARLAARDPKPLLGLLNQLMGMIVLPYRGAEAAAREQRRAAPRPRRRPAAAAAPPADPLRELDMRLTYRTLRVLAAIAELGGRGSDPSSREVADAAGVSDQGQMSKLLWRLQRAGLLANAAAHPGRGVPNAWRLTARGEQVERALRAQAQIPSWSTST